MKIKIQYQYNVYKYAPWATVLSRFLGAFTGIVCFASGIALLLFLGGLYSMIVDGWSNWQYIGFLALALGAFLLGVGFVVLKTKFLDSLIEKIAARETEKQLAALREDAERKMR